MESMVKFKYVCGISHTMIDSLIRIGFSSAEANIYIQLIKKGAMTAVEIAKETRVHRRTIYDNLNIMINKGLVSYYVERGVKYFQANDPLVLKQALEEKNRELESIMPDLASFYANKRKNPNVSIMKGADSTKSILAEMIKAKGEILWMGGGFKILKAIGYSKERLIKELLKLKIRIIQPVPDSEEFRKYFSSSQVKLIPKKYQSEACFFVFSDSVAIGTLVNNDIFAVKIENPDVAKAYRNYFNIIWNS